jgi:hypothetical protein
MHCLRRQLLPPRVKIDFDFLFLKYLQLLVICFLGTKREADLDEVSPSKLKALKASNGTNGEAPTVVDDDSSNHKNGDYHDEEDDDDDVCSIKNSFRKNSFLFMIYR